MKKHKIVVYSGDHKHIIDMHKRSKLTIFNLYDRKNNITLSRKDFDGFVSALRSALMCPQKKFIVWSYPLSVKQIEL